MAESAPSVGSIKSRIAALNLEEVHVPAPGARPAYNYEQVTAKKKAPPPPPPSQRPSGQPRGHTVNNPPLLSNATTLARRTGNEPAAPPEDSPKRQPALPPRPPPRQTPQNSPSLPPRRKPQESPSLPPSLPPRKASEPSIKRRDSTESISTIASIGSAKTSFSGTSYTSNGGSLYHIRAPAYDPSTLPPILSKKAPDQAKPSATLRAMKSKSNLNVADRALPPQLPATRKAPEVKESATLKAMRSKSNLVQDRALPPQLPSRPPIPARNETQAQETAQPQNRQMVPPPQRSALSFGLNKSTETPPPIPTTRPSQATIAQPGVPPPIPLASRPNLSAIMASKPRVESTSVCLKCRDFSGPDNHAARYPRQNIPGSDVAWLAAQLTAPFPSPTDKARAIFTWLHHNVGYDVHSYMNGTVSKSTPERTITTGLAVCEGYASLFAALALKVGMEAIVVGGHGKGAGYSPMKPGDPVPGFKPTGHAWNAVKIDNGEWKLIDPCWGAGNVCLAKGSYEKSFKPHHFTMDNDEFGKTHYPQDNAYFFRVDGRPTISWEEYMMDDMGERLTVYGDATTEHGIGEYTFQPPMKHIKVYDPNEGPVIRFQFTTVCPHWDNERHGKGKPMVLVLNVGGRDGRKTERIPFRTNGKAWWLDVNRIDLGAPGQKINVCAVTSFDNRDGRGLSYAEYKAKAGKVAMAWSWVAMWELI